MTEFNSNFGGFLCNFGPSIDFKMEFLTEAFLTGKSKRKAKFEKFSLPEAETKESSISFVLSLPLPADCIQKRLESEIVKIHFNDAAQERKKFSLLFTSVFIVFDSL